MNKNSKALDTITNKKKGEILCRGRNRLNV